MRGSLRGAAIAVIVFGAAPAAAGENILVLGGDVDAAYAKELQGRGHRLVCRSWLAPAVRADQLKRFHVIVLGGIPDTYGGGLYDPDGLKLLEARQTLAAIREYVQSGGGALFVSQTSGNGQGEAEAMSRALEPWGLRVLGEQVRDPQHQFQNYSWTEAVARHAVTAGVRRVYYPVNLMRWDDAYATNPLAPTDPAWQAVVRGEPTSFAARNIEGSYSDQGWAPATGGPAPVLVAVREMGRGRLAATGIGAQFLLWHVSNTQEWIGENRTGPIDWIPQRKGDGQVPSDLGRLVENLLAWLAEPGRRQGYGGQLPTFDQDAAPSSAPAPDWTRVDWDTVELPRTWAHTAMIHRYNDTVYYPEVPDVLVDGPVQYYKALIGAHSAYSDGEGTVAEYAQAARQAGLHCLVFTEAFEHLTREEWDRLRDDCQKASDDRFVALAGIDVADQYGNRFLLFGQTNYPPAQALTADGKAVVRTQFFSLGFSNHMAAVHRPSTTPLAHELHKHFFGWVVYTYRDGHLVDNGFPGYQWQTNASSNPHPLVVHEVYSPRKVAAEATTGFQQILPGASVRQAVHYFHHGLPHYFACPARYFLSEGPRIDVWTIVNKDEWRVEDRRDHWRLGVGASSDEPIVEAVLLDRYTTWRRWTPKARSFQATVDGWHGCQHFFLLWVRDAKGRQALSPGIRTVPRHYFVRCADRQNWFGTDMGYTGTLVPGFDISVPTFGTTEGRGLWGSAHGPLRGENLAPIKDFPYASNAVNVNEYQVDQRYTRALWEDVVFDAKPSHDTAPSRVWAGRLRRWAFHGAPTWEEVEIRLRQPVTATEPVLPVLTRVNLNAEPIEIPGAGRVDMKGRPFIDVPPGSRVGPITILSEGLRVDGRGQLGLAADPYAAGARPAGTVWQAQLLRVDPKQGQKPPGLDALGLAGPTPYDFKLSRGRLTGVKFVAFLEADRGGVSGEIAPAGIGYALPLAIRGVNPFWDAAVWRPGRPMEFFGVFEGHGWARLDVSVPGPFFAGNIIASDQAQLRLAVVRWDSRSIRIEAHNPTDAPMRAAVETPPQIADRYRLSAAIDVPPGSTRYFVFPAP